MGSDSFQNLHKWKNAELIIRDYEIYVYPRPGFPAENNINARMKMVDAPCYNYRLRISENVLQRENRSGIWCRISYWKKLKKAAIIRNNPGADRQLQSAVG